MSDATPPLNPSDPPRFSESRTAFNAVSRDLGYNWQEAFGVKSLSLVAEGKAALKQALPCPEDALFLRGLGVAMETVNVLTTNWGSGKSNRGALRWADPQPTPPEVLAHRCDDPARLTHEMRRVAGCCGAALVGVTQLDSRWIYAEVQRTHCSPDEPDCMLIHIAPAESPTENEQGLILPAHLTSVIVVAVPMERDMIATAPSLVSSAAASQGYSRAAACVVSLTAYIRAIGYQAIPSLNGTGLSIPLAVDAGLGECGRNGLLITREYGACVRLAKIITDMPLLRDHPVDLGIQAYCRTCKLCAQHCPAHAIPEGDPSAEGHNECNYHGVVKWHVNAKKCLRYWMASGTDCGVCIATCPFTLGKRWGLGLPQHIICRTTLLNPLIARLDAPLLARRRRQASDWMRTS